SVTQDQLDHVFHRTEAGVEFIAPALPGATTKERAINAYILTGLRNLLGGGDGQFADDEARQVCTQYGAYDPNNHSKVLGTLKPEVTGNKSSGWGLTAPGRLKAAQLVKALAPNND